MVWVIAPDRPSGEAFDRVLRANGLETVVDYPQIAPRVIGDKINEDLQVAADLQAAVDGAKYKEIVIACNTLQLWLPKINIPDGVRVYTTFEAAGRKFPDNRPLWLGTTPTVREVKDFPTLLSMNLPELQDLVQEIIWRVKGVTDSDVRMASEDIKDIQSEELLRARVVELLDGLRKNGIREAIMGCTELPIAMEKYATSGNKSGLELVDPAKLLAGWVREEE